MRATSPRWWRSLTRGGVAGEVFNVGEPVTRPIIAWVRQILDAAGHEASLVPVPSAAVPEDLTLTLKRPQHLPPGSWKITRVWAGARAGGGAGRRFGPVASGASAG